MFKLHVGLKYQNFKYTCDNLKLLDFKVLLNKSQRHTDYVKNQKVHSTVEIVSSLTIDLKQIPKLKVLKHNWRNSIFQRIIRKIFLSHHFAKSFSQNYMHPSNG